MNNTVEDTPEKDNTAWPELNDPDFPEAYRVVVLDTSPSNENEPLPFIYNDGGRADAGFKGEARDCVARSIAIASKRPYLEIYRALADGNARQRRSKRTSKRPCSASNGIFTQRQWFKEYMKTLGFFWVPTAFVVDTQICHLRQGELPSGRLVVSTRKHYTAVIDGVLHDTHNIGPRRVYGYWKKM